MGEIIEFPLRKGLSAQRRQQLESDAYYLFIRSVLITADACGFELPFTIESSAEHVYEKTRHHSQLARMLAARSK